MPAAPAMTCPLRKELYKLVLVAHGRKRQLARAVGVRQLQSVENVRMNFPALRAVDKGVSGKK